MRKSFDEAAEDVQTTWYLSAFDILNALFKFWRKFIMVLKIISFFKVCDIDFT